MPEMKPPTIGDQNPVDHKDPKIEKSGEYLGIIQQIKKIDQYNKSIFELYPYDSKRETEQEYYHGLVTLYLKALEVEENINDIPKKDIKKCSYFSENTSELFFALLSKKETRDFLIDSINLEKPDRYKLQTVINELAPFLASGDPHVSTSGIREKPLHEVNSTREKLLTHIDNPRASFFYSAYIKNMCEQDNYVEELNQRIVPIEVAKGVYMDTYGQEVSKTGVFEELKTRLNGTNELTDSDDSDDMYEYFRPLTSKDVGIKCETISPEDLTDFKFFQQKGFRELIEKSLGVPLKELTLPEQFYLLNYLKEMPNERSEALFSFSQEYGLTGFKTFLSIAHGGEEMGGKILNLGEKLPEDIAKKVFEKYSSFIDQATSLEDFIRDNFAKDFTDNKELINKLREDIFKKGKELLISIYDKTNTKDFDVNQIIKDLENIQVEKGLLLSIIKQLKNSNTEFGIEDVLALDLQTLTPDHFILAEHFSNSESLTKEQKIKYEEILDIKQQMKKIYTDNYSDTPELQEELINDFNNFLNGVSKYRFNSGSEINILKYHGKVVSFNRFELVFSKKLNFKSFNVDKNIQGSGIGQMMTKATLDKKAQDNTIVADCLSSKPIGSYYIENGFIARKFYDIHNQPCLSIIRDDRSISEEFKTKTLSIEEILENKNLPEGTVIKKSPTQEACDFSYIVPENHANKSNLLPYQKAPEKYVLTRYFYNKNSSEWITVFEPVKRDLEEFL